MGGVCGRNRSAYFRKLVVTSDQSRIFGHLERYILVSSRKGSSRHMVL
jgi:hypothetical protein